MESKTRIIILRMKEIVYTLLFIFFAIVLIFLFVYMFFIKEKTTSSDAPNSPTYTPGIYTTSIHLGESPIRLQVNVDKDHINSITTAPLEESVTAMFPLLESSLKNIEAQLTSGVALENVVYDDSNQYTASILLDAISVALDKASE